MSSDGSKILVINAGSSSLKFKVFSLVSKAGTSASIADIATSDIVPGLSGLVECIADAHNDCTMTVKDVPDKEGSGTHTHKDSFGRIGDHAAALQHVLTFLDTTVHGSFAKGVVAVGHRVVHGLDFSAPMLVNESTVAKIEEAAKLAPLHNPAALKGISAATAVFGAAVPQVCVFDTAFHQTLPAPSFMYGIPHDLYEKHAIRRYGFHGTSHKYLAGAASVILNKPVNKTNVIICHLGNGCSVTAVRNGESVDTSMGMTPLEGLMMGTRCGDMDPAVVLFLQNTLSLNTQDTDTLLNKKSGLLGVCGKNDVRTIIDLTNKGDAKAKLALDMFTYRVRKYIGSYMAVLGGKVDAIVFSAGIGENSAVVRNLVLQDMQDLGIEVDAALNGKAVGGGQGDIATAASRVRVFVIPTEEELAIAQDVVSVVSASQAK